MRCEHWVMAAGVALALGCGGNKSEPAAPVEQAPAPVAPAPKPAAADPGVAAKPADAKPAPSSVDETGYTLRLSEAGPYKAGELGRVVLQLEPRGVFHINQEYPIEIALTGDADTSFPKADLAKADAAEFGEKKARFDVPFTPKTAGDHKLHANVKFAVCTAENCVPDEQNLSLAVAVK